MIDLYAAGTSNGMRARIALEECGLPYKLNFVDITKGAQPALLEGLPNLTRWAEEMAARPAIQRAVKF